MIEEAHKKLGGVTTGCNVVANVKLALQTLETRGEAMKLPVKGFWRILKHEHNAPEENTYTTNAEQILPIQDEEDDDDMIF